MDVAISVKIHPISTAVVLEDWDGLTEDQRRFFTGARYHRLTQDRMTTGAPSQPYFLCFQTCVYQAAKYCKSQLKIHCAFDLNESYLGYSQQLWALLKADTSFRHVLGDLTLPTGKDAPGLQLADLFAYRSYRYVKQKIATQGGKETGVLLTRMLKNQVDPQDSLLFNREGLMNAMRETFPPYLRSMSSEAVDSKYANTKETTTKEGNEGKDAPLDAGRIP